MKEGIFTYQGIQENLKESLLPILKSRYGIFNLMVEGGATVLKEFISQKLAHLIILTVSPKFFGSGGALATSNDNPFPPFEIKSALFKQIGPDMNIVGYPIFN